MANPKITLSAGISPIEGATGTYLITLDTAAPAGGLMVNYNTKGSTARLNEDYNFTAGKNLSAVTNNSFTIAAGVKMAILNVTTVADNAFDPDERLVLNLTAGQGYDFDANNTTFVKPITVSVDGHPQSIISADFNGDGNADLATVNNNNNYYGTDGTVSVLLGDGSGSFISNPAVSVENYFFSVINADFNGDGNADLAATLGTILLGDGSGGFVGSTTGALGGVSIASADFNGDGNADLATANNDAPISISLGDGSGGFTDSTAVAAGNSSVSIISADFNGDGNADLATANNILEGTVSVILGDGSGGFNGATTVEVDSYPVSVISADFNGDGNADLATANQGNQQDNNFVSVRLGDGRGDFSGDTAFAVGNYPTSIISADFNGDGNADLATANWWDNTVSVGLGDGRGGFTAGTTVMLVRPWSIVSADFNGDGNADLATANVSSNTVSILLNNGNAVSAKLNIVDDDLSRPQYIYGSQNRDKLKGGNGDDHLYGRDGADTLSGGMGNDSLRGGGGTDSLLGGFGDDLLFGGWNRDTLNSSGGNDTLNGGRGHDVLTGGLGSDVFIFDSKPLTDNADKITDFSVADDTIYLKSLQFTQLSTTGVLNADNFVTATTAIDSNDYLVYNKATGALFYDADGSGAGAGIQIATIGINLALTAADFVVI